MSVELLILLYALAGAMEIPVGCFVAAWVWAIMRVVLNAGDAIYKAFFKEKE